MVTPSSITLHNLKAGAFESIYEHPSQYSELLAYYPLLLYDFRVSVIPDFSKKAVLPPLVLQRDPVIHEYFKFMPGSLNSDNKHQNFVISDAQIFTGVPKLALTFAVTFDILADPQNNLLASGVRFNVMEVALHSLSAGVKSPLLRLSIDLIYIKTQEVTVNSATRFEGQLKLVVNASINGVARAEETRAYWLRFSPSEPEELRLVDAAVYAGSVPYFESLMAVVSQQLMLVKVGLPCETASNSRFRLIRWPKESASNFKSPKLRIR